MKSSRVLERILHNWPVKILSIVAAGLLVLLHEFSTMEERYFSIPLTVIEPEEFIAASSYPRSVRVTLKGRQDDIFHILGEDISAYVDFSQASAEGQYKMPVKIRKSGSARLIDSLELMVEPLEIAITLEKKLSRYLSIDAATHGFPAEGYEMASYQITPSTVQVTGPRTHIESLNRAVTRRIDLTGRKDDFSLTVGLENSDPLIFFPAGNQVVFSAVIQEVVEAKTFSNIEIIPLDLDLSYDYSMNPEGGSIILQGSQKTLNIFNPETVALEVDCSSIKRPGVYILPVKIDTPDDIILLKWEPREVQITVTKVDGS